jgi:hypothetical protein
MGGALWGGLAALEGWFDVGLWSGVAGLAILVSGGLVIYAALGLLLGVATLGELRRLLRRSA